MHYERQLAGILLVAAFAAMIADQGVLAGALFIFGAAGLIDAYSRSRREPKG